MSYEVIKAASMEDAIEKSVWRKGDLGKCIRVVASSNSKGTYSVFPEFERIDITWRQLRRHRQGRVGDGPVGDEK